MATAARHGNLHFSHHQGEQSAARGGPRRTPSTPRRPAVRRCRVVRPTHHSVRLRLPLQRTRLAPLAGPTGFFLLGRASLVVGHKFHEGVMSSSKGTGDWMLVAGCWMLDFVIRHSSFPGPFWPMADSRPPTASTQNGGAPGGSRSSGCTSASRAAGSLIFVVDLRSCVSLRLPVANRNSIERLLGLQPRRGSIDNERTTPLIARRSCGIHPSKTSGRIPQLFLAIYESLDVNGLPEIFLFVGCVDTLSQSHAPASRGIRCGDA